MKLSISLFYCFFLMCKYNCTEIKRYRDILERMSGSEKKITINKWKTADRSSTQLVSCSCFGLCPNVTILALTEAATAETCKYCAELNRSSSMKMVYAFENMSVQIVSSCGSENKEIYSNLLRMFGVYGSVKRPNI